MAVLFIGRQGSLTSLCYIFVYGDGLTVEFAKEKQEELNAYKLKIALMLRKEIHAKIRNLRPILSVQSPTKIFTFHPESP